LTLSDYLTPGTRKLIQTRMERGGYASADDLVVAALASLDQQERFGDFEPSEMDKLLAEGESGGEFLDGAAALAARRRRRAERQPKPPAKSA
jgi:Arc/MetJ-type ribon-helix-helix transcriptional regulator